MTELDDELDAAIETLVLGKLKYDRAIIESYARDRDDVDLWDAMNQVMAYYMSPEDFQKDENREVPKDFIDFVVSCSKEYREKYSDMQPTFTQGFTGTTGEPPEVNPF